jgi:uncharacterized protein YegP (UPF0339 family)
MLSPARARADAGQLVTFQVLLDSFRNPVVAADLTLTYPTAAVRLSTKQPPRLGSVVPANAVIVYTDDGMMGKLRVVISSPGPVGGGGPGTPPASQPAGVLAEVTFEVLPGAASQYAWNIGLGPVLASSDGYALRRFATKGAVLIGRGAVAARLGSKRFDAGGVFRFNLNGDAGADYVVETSADLVHWTQWQTVTAGADAVEVQDDGAAAQPRRFYRVRPTD